MVPITERLMRLIVSFLERMIYDRKTLEFLLLLLDPPHLLTIV